MHYVYILKSMKFNEIYIGYTSDLRNRFKEHNEGKSQSTKRYMPWKLVYYEAYSTEDDARNRKFQLKQYGQTLAQLKRRIKASLR